MTQQRRTPIDDSLETEDLFHSIRTRIAERDKATAARVFGDPVARGPGDSPRDAWRPRPDRHRRGWAAALCWRGRYVIESQVGSAAGMGTVYKALDRSRSEHTEIDARVAIRYCMSRPVAGHRCVETAPRVLFGAGFAHPNVVKVTSWISITISRSSPWS